MIPFHAPVGLKLDDNSNQSAHKVDAVESEEEDDGIDKEPAQHHSLPWLRWKMNQQPRFQGEVNVLERVVPAASCGSCRNSIAK
jgi:hypothetical protein